MSEDSDAIHIGHLCALLAYHDGWQPGDTYKNGGRDRELTCWCKPFIIPIHPSLDPAQFSPQVFHRPSPTYVFWDYDEQGPRGVGEYTT